MMPNDYVDIIYSANLGIVRRIIVPDSDNKELDAHPLLPGEARSRQLKQDVIKSGPLPDVSAATTLVSQQTGKQIPSGVCAVIDKTGAVVSLIMADPEIDSIEGCTIVASDIAQVGWLWTEQEGFAAPKAVAKA